MHMKEENKKIISIAIIIILLPYIITVFVRGEGMFPVNASLVNRQVYVLVNGEEVLITWNEYLIGVLAKEIPEEYAFEAMKAQAIIIRTRLAIEQDGDDEYVFQDNFYSTEDIQQKWGNNSLELYNQLVDAIEETDGMTLLYNEVLASTPYHQLNTGMTRNGNEVFASEEYSYLASVMCPLDLQAEEEISISVFTYEEVIQGLELEIDNANEELDFDDFQISECDTAGYVLEVSIQENTISGELFRTELGLKSSAFSFQDVDGELQITTEGSGHGLGLSQNTAHYMALEGKTHEEIIAYFYSGTEIVVD